MKFVMSQKLVAFSLIFAFTVLVFSACQSAGEQPIGSAQTPTEAYKMLYAAVKSKDIEKIKKMMSKNSLEFAQAAAQQQNKPVEKVLENGFLATTLSASLPQIRDERVKESFGAVEVWNEKERRWEDTYFIREEDGWKVAVGDVFRGNFEMPGKPQSIVERENANMANPNNGMIQAPVPNMNANVNSIPMTNVKVQQPPAPQPQNGSAEKKGADNKK
jgi:hypothetical protein